MKKRLRKKIITICFDKIPMELYKVFLNMKCNQNILQNYYHLVKEGKKDGYKSFFSISGPEGTIYKKLKK